MQKKDLHLAQEFISLFQAEITDDAKGISDQTDSLRRSELIEENKKELLKIVRALKKLNVELDL